MGSLRRICVIAILAALMGSALSMESYGSEAVYKDMVFGVGKSGEYSSFHTGTDQRAVASIYVRRPGNKVAFHFPQITEDQVAELWPNASSKNLAGEIVYSRGGNLDSNFGFAQGKLVACSLNSIADLEIGPSANGEFISFPAKQRDVHRIFGKPLKHNSYRRART